MPSSSPPGRLRALPRAAVSLHTRLVWVTVFRTVATSLFLLSVAVRLLAAPPAELSRADTLSFAVIAVAYLSTLVYGLMLRRGRVGRPAARAQVVGDVLVASALVFLTGGPESPLVFAYSLAVLGAAVVLDWRGTLLTAAGSAACFTLLVAGTVSGWLAPPLALPLTLGRAAFLLASNVLALFLVAVLAGYLAGELSAAGGALSAREADLERLGVLHGQILDAMPSGLVTCTREGRISFVNPAARAILGLSDGAVGQDVEALLPGVLGLGSRTTRRELSVTTPGGPRVLGLSLTPLAEGAFLVVFQDLTDLRRMEEDLKRADQLAAVGTLSAQLAHEVRNPLAAMRGSAQLLRTEPGADAGTVRLTDIIVREADRLSDLVEDFLRFARPPAPRRREVALDALVSETVDMLRTDLLARNVWLDVEAEPVRAEVDPDQLRQVLINLLRNAFQAAGPGGVVRASVAPAPGGGGARIRVWDSAGSIPAEDLPRLFEPFFTTREGGTGLGLSTAFSIVRAHGGTLTVRSSPREGTEFVVGLEANPEAG